MGYRIRKLYGLKWRGLECAPRCRVYGRARRYVWFGQIRWGWNFTAVLWLDDEMFKGRGHSRAAALEDLRSEVAQHEARWNVENDFPEIYYGIARCPSCGKDAENIGPCFGCKQPICELCADTHMAACERAAKDRELLS
jgi:hypothetical protein